MCYGEIRILYRWELFAGRYQPKELASPYFKRGPGTSTMEFMWRTTKPSWVTGKSVTTRIGLYMFIMLIGMF